MVLCSYTVGWGHRELSDPPFLWHLVVRSSGIFAASLIIVRLFSPRQFPFHNFTYLSSWLWRTFLSVIDEIIRILSKIYSLFVYYRKRKKHWIEIHQLLIEEECKCNASTFSRSLKTGPMLYGNSDLLISL